MANFSGPVTAEERLLFYSNFGRVKADEHVGIKRWVSVSISCIILVSLGFPGLYTEVFGGFLKPLLEYGTFILQLFIMVIYSGNRLSELRLIGIKKKYAWIYFFLVVIFIVSMIGTSDLKEQAISCIRISVTALFALWICDHLTLEEMLSCVYQAMVMYVIVSVAFAIMFPGYYDRLSDQENAFLGIENTKNVTATVLSFGIVMQFLLWKVRTAMRVNVTGFFAAFLAAQMFLMVLADSTGAIITCIITSFMVLRLGDSIRVNLGMVCALSSVLFLIGAMTILPVMAPILEALGKDATLTGRLPLWAHLLDVIRTNHTMVGYGYGHFWFDEEAVDLVHTGFSSQSFMSKQTGGAHNNLIELWLNTGLVGLLAFGAMLIGAFSKPRQIEADKYVYCMAYMAFYTLIGFTERGWTTFEYKMLFLFIAAGYACHKVSENTDAG